MRWCRPSGWLRAPGDGAHGHRRRGNPQNRGGAPSALWILRAVCDMPATWERSSRHGPWLEGQSGCTHWGSQGIGLAIARGLAAEGVHLALCARNEEQVVQVAREIGNEFGVKAVGVQADVSQADGPPRKAGDQIRPHSTHSNVRFRSDNRMTPTLLSSRAPTSLRHLAACSPTVSSRDAPCLVWPITSTSRLRLPGPIDTLLLPTMANIRLSQQPATETPLLPGRYSVFCATVLQASPPCASPMKRRDLYNRQSGSGYGSPRV